MNKSSALLVAPLLLLQLALLAVASPIRYDQRQDGDSNVDARLSNFFVVLAPSNTAQLSNTGVSLLDLASKAVPLRLRPQAAADGLKQREEAEPEQEVKEVKAGRSVQTVQGPLAAVAIPAAILQSPLAKLHPEVQALAVEEVLIARSPVVALKTPAGPTPAGAPSAAVPMLVAIPVPEVAPERPAAPPALLPMHPLGDKQAPAAPAAEAVAIIASEASAVPQAVPQPIAVPEVAAVPEAVAIPEAAVVPEAVAVVPEIIAVPEAASFSEAIAAAEAVVAAADEVDAPAPAIAEVLAAAAEAAAPVENAPPAVETNQVEPEIVKKVELPKVHLIGTGIEECGPERIRNQEGVCVDEPKQD